MENSTVGLTLLPPGRTVPLDRDGLGGHDDDVLDRYRPHDRAERREVAVVLAWCEPEGGRDPGLLEVRLDGRVLGRLDHRTSQQYARLVDDVLDRGELPACTACLRSTAHGVVVELQMPRVAASHAAGDHTAADHGAGDHTAADRGAVDHAAEPVTTRLPLSLPDHVSVPDHADAPPSGEAPPKPSPTRRRDAPASPAALATVPEATPDADATPEFVPEFVPGTIPPPAPIPDSEVTAIHPVTVPPPRRSPDPLIGFPRATDDWSPPPLETFPAVVVDWSVAEPAPRTRRAGPWWIAAGVAAVLLTAGLVGRAAVHEPASPQAVVTTPVAPPSTTAPATSTGSATPSASRSTSPSAVRTSKSKARPATPSTTRRATPSTTRRATPTTTRGAATPVRYPNCASARAAGAAPLAVGEPGYSAALDTDGDGLACE